MPVWQRGSLPVLSIPAAMQKNDTEEAIPLLPGFESVLHETPQIARREWVFNPASLQTKYNRKPRGRRPDAEWVGKVITMIGEKANVIVEPAKGEPETPGYKPPKYASAHDFRRAFADRLAAAGVPERDLAAIMRHSSVETTRRHYAPGNVQRTAGSIRKKLGQKLALE